MSTPSSRVGAFDTGESRSSPFVDPGSASSTFHDILPSTSITSITAPVDKTLFSSALPSEQQRSFIRSRFVDAVRKSAVPRMQGVVNDLLRSRTAGHTRPESNSDDADGERLLHQGGSDLDRSLTTESDSGDTRRLLRGSSELK
ncbi:hypothetical protein H0H93_011088 [Arthromyces matolae]|nr:hypothetical protein H0H93_011088 [Arthromyces matolae]